MKLIWLPLESFELRYTKDWARWFPREFRRLGVEYLQVDGIKLTERIEVGSVLDALGTHHWKFTQLAELIREMRAGEITSKDTLFFADLWYPGIEALRYISCLGGQKPKIAGILHAGTWDPADFLVRSGMKPWAHQLEEAWFNIYDLIFVATKYHKALILNSHQVDPDKIVVTGLPFYPDELSEHVSAQKENMVVFPHRLDPEKQPEEFDGLVDLLSPQFPKVQWVKTAKVCQTKQEYYRLLGQARVVVSLSLQETFGIAMLEATALGCIPLVPNRLSYPELYSPSFVYSSYGDLVEKLRSLLSGGLDLTREWKEICSSHRNYLTKSIERMLERMI